MYLTNHLECIFTEDVELHSLHLELTDKIFMFSSKRQRWLISIKLNFSSRLHFHRSLGSSLRYWRWTHFPEQQLEIEPTFHLDFFSPESQVWEQCKSQRVKYFRVFSLEICYKIYSEYSHQSVLGMLKRAWMLFSLKELESYQDVWGK